MRLDQLRLCRPRTWGACWLGDLLWRELRLDAFFAPRLGVSREGTDWEKVLRALTIYRLLSPGSEWRLHRYWFGQSALADLLGADERLAQDDTRRFGYSRDKRRDCVQVIVALVVTPDGLPLAYEMLPGNTADKTTLRQMLDLIARRYGAAERIWVMDRGIPTEAVLAELRGGNERVKYLVGTPKGRLSKLESQLAERPWQQVRVALRVKLLPQEGEVYVLAESGARAGKERAMRKRRLKALAGGLMPRVVFEKLATIQLLDVCVPTTDGWELLLVRHTEPEKEVALLLARLGLNLPAQPPPRIRTSTSARTPDVVATSAGRR